MAIARSLAEGFRAGLRPPEDVLEAYLARIERDQEQLNELRQRMADLKVR
jgi:Asp-tRNA(Asn)/Glu-tRNA(Gln) amidotransferase A subunit family amidase